MTDSELEELQLQVEGGICKFPISEMEQLVDHIGLELKEYKGKSKLAMLKIVCVKVKDELRKTENKFEYLTELQNFITGMLLPFEDVKTALRRDFKIMGVVGKRGTKGLIALPQFNSPNRCRDGERIQRT